MTEAHAVESMIAAAIGAVVPDVADCLDQLDPDVDLWQALGLDSLDHLAIVERLATDVGCDIPESDYPRLISMAGLRGYLASLSP